AAGTGCSSRAVIAAAAALVLAAPALAARPHVEARAFLVENGGTGEILYGSKVRERVPIASITKLMTVLVALDHARLASVVRVSPTAAAVGESTIYLRPGERISVGDLVKAALIPRAHDAADALADYAGGRETRLRARLH